MVLLPRKVYVPDGHGVRIGDGRALLHGPQVVQLHGAHNSVSLLRPMFCYFAQSVMNCAALTVLLCWVPSGPPHARCAHGYQPIVLCD